MQVIDSKDLYAYICTDIEWYGTDEATRKLIVDQCLGAAKDRGRPHAAVFCQPDQLLPLSPNPNRHQVWRHTFPVDAEVLFKADLLCAITNGYAAKLPKARMAALLQEQLKELTP